MHLTRSRSYNMYSCIFCIYGILSSNSLQLRYLACSIALTELGTNRGGLGELGHRESWATPDITVT